MRSSAATCAHKARYGSKAEAALVCKGAQNNRGVKLRPYRCSICSEWHTTHLTGPQLRAIKRERRAWSERMRTETAS